MKIVSAGIRNTRNETIWLIGVLTVSALAAFGQPAVPAVPVVPSPVAGPKTGLLLKKEGVSTGYVLIAPPGCNATYLINNDGFVVHEWNFQKRSGKSAYVLPNGHLLHAVRSSTEEVGDTIQELTWDSEVVWEYATDQATQRMHHDIERLPNGNTLVTVWERIPHDDYVAAGRNPDTVPNNEMWVDAIHEIKPTGKNSGEVVWRWSAWDYPIQNFDKKRANYGDPSEHPYKIDLNQLREETGRFNKLSDWLHINSVSYDPKRDEIMLSSQALSEIWVVSRKTGKWLYRWGNPRRYGKGGTEDQVLFNQHDAHVIPDGYRGAGNILLFQNVNPVSDGKAQYSSAVEAKPPLTASGEWPSPNEEGVLPPCKVVWEYAGKPNETFYSPIFSNVQRLEGGGTLIGVGAQGLVLELDADDSLVWKYRAPAAVGRVKLKKLEKWNSLPAPAPNTFFRAYKYAPDYSAFEGRDLAPMYMLGGAVPAPQTVSPATP